MKKGLLSIVICVGFISSFAQTPHFGLKGGLNAANLSREGSGTSDFKIGFHLGGLAHIHMTNHFAIQPEIVYSQQGGKNTFGNVENKIKLNYVNIPVLAQYMFGKGFRLEGGPQLGLLASAKQKIGSAESDVAGSFKSTDISFVAGFGLLGPAKLGVDFRWTFGLNNINKVPNGVSTRNNVAQLGLFYQFDHKGKR
ncbi:porin family protein [Segetibacter aerophilus]|uniref:Outer membrane protein beta-barrel domain-containing protein n=1 Tax=Segetibacter aerophilus TaxID=670293 RepID=A0A512BJT5_9BACT|nr:porin family protein [Segetibacter aerophilus]GEO12229.1 hypothetical protein SAE01_47250 [Segetibacter aerophilus]